MLSCVTKQVPKERRFRGRFGPLSAYVCARFLFLFLFWGGGVVVCLFPSARDQNEDLCMLNTHSPTELHPSLYRSPNGTLCFSTT